MAKQKEQKLRANSYMALDFETGGLVEDKDRNPKKLILSSREYAITDFACLTMRGTDLSELIRYDDLLKPYDDKLKYSPEAAKATGITKKMCIEEGVDLEEVKENLLTVYQEANDLATKHYKLVLVLHNGRFDIPFFVDLNLRCGIDISKYIDGDWDHFGNFHPRYIDTERLAIQKWGGDPKIRSFSLHECCKMAEIDLVGAHRAMPDTLATAELFRKLTMDMRVVHLDLNHHSVVK